VDPQERERALNERIDQLLTEAGQMGVGLDEVIEHIHKRSEKFDR